MIQRCGLVGGNSWGRVGGINCGRVGGINWDRLGRSIWGRIGGNILVNKNSLEKSAIFQNSTYFVL